jgi:hypothetical protein
MSPELLFALIGILTVGVFVFILILFVAAAVYNARKAIDERRRRDDSAAAAARLQTLYGALDSSFSPDELRDLCFEMGIDYDALPGEGKSARARELVAYCQRHGRLPELVANVVAKRPHFGPLLET